MKVVTLLENTTSRKDLKAEHGICLYIETDKHKLLIDVGPDGTFLKNAKKLGIDISKVDTVIITHGHSDHGGGIQDFLKVNHTAKIYIRDNALLPHYTKVLGMTVSVGLKVQDYTGSQIVQTGETYEIDDELLLFSRVTERELYSCANNNLYMKVNGKMQLDDFSHEQSVIIRCDGKQYLIGGCGHCGAVNIMERAVKLTGKPMDVMITGLHIMKNLLIKGPGEAFNRELAARLRKYDTKFYTLHCTGKAAYEHMKSEMGEQMKYLSTGDSIEI